MRFFGKKLTPSKEPIFYRCIILFLILGLGPTALADQARSQEIFSAIRSYGNCIGAAHQEQALKNLEQLDNVKRGRCYGPRIRLEELVDAELLRRVDNRIAENIIKDLDNINRQIIRED